jgi:hypothetical protein
MACVPSAVFDATGDGGVEHVLLHVTVGQGVHQGGVGLVAHEEQVGEEACREREGGAGTGGTGVNGVYVRKKEGHGVCE